MFENLKGNTQLKEDITDKIIAKNRELLDVNIDKAFELLEDSQDMKVALGFVRGGMKAGETRRVENSFSSPLDLLRTSR